MGRGGSGCHRCASGARCRQRLRPRPVGHGYSSPHGWGRLGRSGGGVHGRGGQWGATMAAPTAMGAVGTSTNLAAVRSAAVSPELARGAG